MRNEWDLGQPGGMTLLARLIRMAGDIAQVGPNPVRRRAVLIDSLRDAFSLAAVQAVVFRVDTTTATEPIAEVVASVDSGLDFNSLPPVARLWFRPFAQINPLTVPLLRRAAERVPSCLSRSELIGDAAWNGHEFRVGIQQSIRADDMIASLVPVADVDKSGGLCSVVICWTPLQAAGAIRDLPPIVHVLHRELAFVFSDRESSAGTHIGSLPQREQETFDRLLKGYSEKQIAYELSRSRHTVHSYVKRIYKKFGVTSRAELLSLIYGQGGSNS
jgi:DNA-binding CsgD family transcriptional regulator